MMTMEEALLVVVPEGDFDPITHYEKLARPWLEEIAASPKARQVIAYHIEMLQACPNEFSLLGVLWSVFSLGLMVGVQMEKP